MNTRFLPFLCFFTLGSLILGGCLGEKDRPENLVIPRLLVETRGMDYGAAGGAVVTLPVSGTTIQVQEAPVATEFEFRNVEMVKVDLGLALLIQLDDMASRRLYRASVSNMGGRLVLLVNGNAIGARRIDGAIQDGNVFTFVEVPDEDLGELVIDLKESIEFLKTQEEE